MEHGTKCPAWGADTSFTDITATGQWTHGLRGDREATLRLELVCE